MADFEGFRAKWLKFVLKRGRSKSEGVMSEISSSLDGLIGFFESYPDILRAFRMLDFSNFNPDDHLHADLETDVTTLIKAHKDLFISVDAIDLTERHFRHLEFIVETYKINNLEDFWVKYHEAKSRFLIEYQKACEFDVPKISDFRKQLEVYQSILTRMNKVLPPSLSFNFMEGYLVEKAFGDVIPYLNRFQRMFSYRFKGYLRALMIVHFRSRNPDYNEGLFDSYDVDTEEALLSLKRHLNLVFKLSVGFDGYVYKGVGGFGSKNDRFLGYTMINDLGSTKLYKNGIDKDSEKNYSLTEILGGNNVFALRG